MRYINLNGRITEADSAGVPIDNGAFRFGYGLFESILVQGGAIKLKEYHWVRLFAGMKQLYFEVPMHMTSQWLEEQVLDTVKKNGVEQLCRVRLQVFAVGGALFGPHPNNPEMLIECMPLDAREIYLNETGLVVGTASGISKSANDLSNIKSCSALIYAVAAQQAKEKKWDEALITNTDGNIIEGTIANIFWIKNEMLFTPPLSEGCIAGTMRQYIMDTMPVTEKPLTEQELSQADEVFLTNAIKMMRWVRTWHNVHYNNEHIKKIFANLSDQ